jgi:hypothetical protein
MNKVLTAILILSTLIIYSCNKDSANTRPSLTLVSFNPEVIPVNGNAQVRFTFGDKESDLDTLVIYKTRINRQTTATTRDSLKFGVPDFGKTATGDLFVDLTYQNHLISATNPPTSGNPPRRQPDTLLFRFVLRDKAKNVSDTVVSSPIVVIR